MADSIKEGIYKAVEELVREFENRIVAVALFGSFAREEASEQSDFDFFVVVKNFDEKNRRYSIYQQLHKILKRDITLIDVDENSILKEDLMITPLLLNIAWDSMILYDPTSKLGNLFERIRNGVKDKLERYKTKDHKYGWKPKTGSFTTIEV